MQFLLYLFVFLFGLIVGSFLNVVILRLGSGQVWRLETGEASRRGSGQGLGGRSHCPKCGHVLRWYDLIPILSFFVLRRRCRYCGQKISWQYPMVEITTASLFLLITNYQLPITNEFKISQFSNFLISDYIGLIFWLFIMSCLIVIFVYDLRHYLIPDKIIYPAIIISVLFRAFEVLNFAHWNLFGIWDLGFGIWKNFFIFLLSAFGAAAFFLAVVLITRGRGMGLGDVKLAFLMGLVLGWPQILLALLLAFGSGAIVGVGLIIANRKTLKSQIPFGPFLAAGTIFTFLAGPYLINWYLSFFGL